jgi:hypothetical protein
MEITGWDTVIFTFTAPRVVFERVAASVLSRWPAALVEGLRPAGAGSEPVAGLPVERFPAGPGHLIFYRGVAMARHMEEAAYTPMADGDGPFAVITRARRGVEFAVSGLEERRAADHDAGGVRPPDPYRAWLCAPEVIEVTAVTPGEPESHPFSSWVLGEVKRACSEAATGPGNPDLPRRPL